MTTKTEQRLSEIENALLKLAEERKKPSRIRQLWNWGKPYIIPFILGMMFAQLFPMLPLTFSPQPVIEQKMTLEQQAALGGAAIPFPNGKPSPTLSASPPENSKTEPTSASWTKTSAPPLPANPRADNGQKISTGLFRRQSRPTR
jgi:hypothetical protein